MDLEEAADGVVRVINATMVRGMRAASVAKGHDPREFTLVAFGGGGPVHAAELARSFGAPEVLVPIAPGVTSALGLLMSDVRYDFSATYLRPLEEADAASLTRLYVDLEHQALEQMARDRIAPQDVVLSRTAEARYRGQGFELEVAVPSEALDAAAIERVRTAFHALHEQHYGYTMPGEPLVLVNAQVTALGALPKPELVKYQQDGRQQPSLKGRRPVYAGGHWTDAAVYDRIQLQPAMTIDGPAIVEQVDSTTLLLPGDRGRIDPFGNLIVRVAGA
ncbi:MAG: hypothetical protein JOZ81_00540 [Chloroflexi bacterium]|nr:hypothetical protein [Chloroflexota bacterium]MBV9603111.1 hypothetical protein [Chloroflexota bacterium]